MDLVEIDVIGLEAAERALDGLDDPAPRIALLVRILAHGAMHLGGEHDLVATAFQRLADDLLRLALAVSIGGVDEIDADIQRLVNDAGALVMIGVGDAAEHHRAEAVGADLDACAAQGAVMHARLLVRDW